MRSVTQTDVTSHRGGRGARTRILTAASELFYCEGVNATGVELIAIKASVSKRTPWARARATAEALIDQAISRSV